MRLAGFVLPVIVALCACSRPEPGQITSELFDDFSQHRLTAAQAAAVADDLAGYVSAYFDAVQGVLEAGRPACAATEALDLYLSALAADGRAGECVEVARSCLRAGDGGRDAVVRLSLAGARCAAIDDRFEDAFELFDAATARSLRGAVSPGAIFAFASFTERSPYEAKTETVLARLKRVPGFDQSDVDMLRALLEVELTGKSARASLDALEGYVTRRLASADALLADGLSVAWQSILSRRAYRFSDALVFVQSSLPRLGFARLFGASAHKIVFRAINDVYTQPGGLALAREVNSRYLLHARPAFDLLVEKNPFTYAELYGDACATTLLQGAALKSLTDLSDSFRAGELSAAQALARARDLQAISGDKADLLAFIGSLHEERDDDERAAELYWRSHEACPHYNRSHWGLSGVRLRRWQRGFPDYERRVASIGETLARVEFPSSFETYVTNYASLGRGDLRRLKYSLRFWAPYVDFLVDNDQSTYIKRSYELLGEAPGLSRLRGMRVTYPYDYRLWDDVRGIGGSRVVVDRAEMRGAAFGAYNLGGHEVAHQWHGAAPLSLRRCIRRLYDLAKERQLFADAYAATNEYEYFAQGVTYYMVQDDAPRAFGLTQRWVKENDPKLHQLLVAVAAGDLDAISCPVTVADQAFDSEPMGELVLSPHDGLMQIR
jgi:tetratricopeptide (TPR) repeat protein